MKMLLSKTTEVSVKDTFFYIVSKVKVLIIQNNGPCEFVPVLHYTINIIYTIWGGQNNRNTCQYTIQFKSSTNFLHNDPPAESAQTEHQSLHEGGFITGLLDWTDLVLSKLFLINWTLSVRLHVMWSRFAPSGLICVYQVHLNMSVGN